MSEVDRYEVCRTLEDSNLLEVYLCDAQFRKVVDGSLAVVDEFIGVFAEHAGLRPEQVEMFASEAFCKMLVPRVAPVALETEPLRVG